MREQGRSTLTPGVGGRILDRLIGLEKAVPQALIRQALATTGRVNGRACLLTHEIMLWVVLAMGLLTDLPIRQVFKHARRLRPGEKTPGRSSLCQARKRLGIEPVQELHRLVVRPLATPQTSGAFYRGLRLMGIDGVVMDVPDSEANAVFGRSSGGRGEGPFPQVRKVSLVELGTHVETAIAIGTWHDSERELASQLFDQIPSDALLLADRGFFCYDDWKTLDSRAKLLIRVSNSLLLKPIQRFSDGSYLAKIYRSSHDREKDRQGMIVRVIEYTLNDPQRKGHGERHRLITNLMDAEQCPAMDLIELYHERWEEELVFDEQKTHQDPRRAEKPAQLRSETPEGVKQELYALSLGHFVVRSLMFTAAETAQLDPDRLSFTGCFQVLQCRLPECPSPASRSFTPWFEAMLAEMRQELLPQRRNRVNPRVIKRKMSKWNKKRASHRRPPPLRKSFQQSVVIKT